MAQQVRKRKQKTINYTPNTKIADELSRGFVYRELYLHLKGQVTLTGLNNVYANILRGDEWAVITRIDIRANGTDVIRSFDANTLRWLNYFWYGIPPRVSPLLGAGGANPTFDAVMILPFWQPKSVRPMDTALNSRNLSTLEVEITWGDHTSIAAAATGFTVAPTLDIYSTEVFGIDGPFAQLRQFTIEKEITADNQRFQIDLPVGNMYRGFLINTHDAGVDDGDVINNFKLISGTTVYADLSEEILGAAEPLRTGMFQGFSGTAFDDLFIGDGNSLDGWYLHENVMDGLNTEAIDTIGFSEIVLEFDVNVGGGTTKLLVTPFEIVPVRGGGNG